MASDDNGKIVAVLAYFLVGIIWFFVDENVKQNPLARFHVKQALVLLLLSIVISVVLGALSWLWFAPLFWIVSKVVNLVVLVLWIIGIVYAATGKQKNLPVIGMWAEKFSF